MCLVYFVFLLLVASISNAQQNSLSTDESYFKETFGTLVSFSTLISQRKPSIDVSGLKKKYIFKTSRVNWWKAREMCETEGLAFASIQSYPELQAFLADYKEAGMKANRMWIGGSDLGKEGTFVWATRPPVTFSYTSWASGEPNNLNSEEHCLDIWPNNGGIWNDSQCEADFQFACEQFV